MSRPMRAWREYLVRRALEFDPDNTDALFELASLLRVLRRYDEALELLERHRRLVPDDFQALADIGRCLSGLQRFAEAETCCAARSKDWTTRTPATISGLVLDRRGRFAEAIAEYQRALGHNPNHRDALNNLGVGFARQGNLVMAARQFEHLVAADPDNADAHTNLGAMFLTQGARERAAREFRTALATQSGSRPGARRAAAAGKVTTRRQPTFSLLCGSGEKARHGGGRITRPRAGNVQP